MTRHKTPTTGRQIGAAALSLAALLAAPLVSAQTVAIADYFPPLLTGNTWQYNTNIRLASSGPYTPYGGTLAAGNNLTIHGVSTTPLNRTSTFPGDAGDNRYYSIGAAGLRLHRENLNLAGTIYETYPAPVQLTPANVTVGQTYNFNFNYSGYILGTPDYTGSTTGSIQILGFENVTVPLGTFNALKLSFETAWTEVDGAGGVNETWWLVENIGLARWDAIIYNDYEEPDSYIDYSARLASASLIPQNLVDGDADIDDADLGAAFASYTGPGATGKFWFDGDTDGDGDVDDGDLGFLFAAYTGPLAPAVAEPTSAALLALGGLAMIRHRRA